MLCMMNLQLPQNILFRRYNQQLMYYSAMGIVNLAIVYFWFHHVDAEEKACFFDDFATKCVVIIVATGAPLSMIFLALFQRLVHVCACVCVCVSPLALRFP